jgi:hypothetical protein
MKGFRNFYYDLSVSGKMIYPAADDGLQMSDDR